MGNPVKDYRKFHAEREEELKRRYYCNKAGGFCKRNKCEMFLNCNRPEKKNYEKWVDAYEKDKKDILVKLCKGEYNGNTIS